ncbi:efflux RND transporter periplasmic adaptor subunit [Leptolyngbya sp. 7M]|uniref:efflux RND transporter periplasmic adaptor subunit n=1 Tax=Leptolyngbya sp. 7M TaxID=2812896 RepID=UPI001B8D399D|nr:efflux RND transporter periplasmic adaptor subunit [Leptolyngbya sp. 7M]QYO66744.1 efflux RND transporter periplasmic adaptor subunit [Leptolyngbya sp. 7M]
MRSTIIQTGIFAVLVSAFASGCGSRVEKNTNTDAAATSVEVTTAQATLVNIPTYVEATGNLASDAQSDVAPAVGGKIVEVNFDIGSYVQQGAVLVRLDPRDANIRLEQARAQLEQQRQAVQQAEANVEQAIANLRQTQARLGIADGQTFQIKDFSQVKSITAQLELAEKELRRAERLLATGDISRALYDQRRSQRDSLLGQLDEARSNAAVAIKAIDTARAAVDTARAAVGPLRAGVATAQTQVNQAQKSVSDTIVTAPISGYVSERNADVGEYISPNTPNAKLATIVRTSTLRVKIDIPEANVGKVATGQGVSVQVTAYPDRKFAGSVVRIAPSLNPTTRVLNVEAEVQNVDGLLKPGQFATVRITQSKPEPAVMIPVTAVRTVGDTNSVFVIKDGAAREVIVQLGLLENDMIQVKRGLVEGDTVAVSNIAQLTDGVFVRQ